jgi:hypothetical protein
MHRGHQDHRVPGTIGAGTIGAGTVDTGSGLSRTDALPRFSSGDERWTSLSTRLEPRHV